MTDSLSQSSYFSEVIGLKEEADCVTIALPIEINEQEFLIFSSHHNVTRKLRMLDMKNKHDCVQLDNPNPFYNFRFLPRKKKVLCVTWGRIFYFDPFTRIFEPVPNFGQMIFRTCFSLQSVISKDEDYIILGSWKGRFHGCLMRFYLEKRREGNSTVNYTTLYRQEETIFALRKLKKDDQSFAFGGGNLRRDGGKDYRIRIFSISENCVVKSFPLIHTNRINMIRTYVSRDNGLEYFVSGGADEKIILWNEHGHNLCSLDCSERIQCILPIDQNNYLIGGSVHNKPGGNIFHLSLKTGKFEMLSTKCLEARFIWNLYWFSPDDDNSDVIKKRSKGFAKFVMTSGIKDDKVHVITLDDHFFDTLVNVGDDVERECFVFDNFGISYVRRFLCVVGKMVLFDGPRLFIIAP